MQPSWRQRFLTWQVNRANRLILVVRHQDHIMSHSLEIRVNRLKKQIEGYAKSPDHELTLEPVTAQTKERLRALEYFPLDMLVILEQIGCMRGWGQRGAATGEMFQMIDWWMPCTIECASAEDRCLYELFDSNFQNPSSLLFFAWDCDAKCYFYDITVTPWKVVVCDGLGPSLDNQEKQMNTSEVIKGLDARVTLWEEEESGDALSVIERWAFY